MFLLKEVCQQCLIERTCKKPQIKAVATGHKEEKI